MIVARGSLLFATCLHVAICFGQAKAPLPPPPASVAPLDGSERLQLDRAETLWRDGPPEEVVEAYRQVIDQHGGRLIPRPAQEKSTGTEFLRYSTVREWSWMRLATLRTTAPAVFSSLRRQLDPQAKRWFEQAKAERDKWLHQRIVDELFLSSFGDDALLHLGELALDRGDYSAARRYWEKIGPGLRFPVNRDERLELASNRPLWLPFVGVSVDRAWPVVSRLFAESTEPTELVYPDSDLNLAEVRARLVMVSLLEGNLERARIETAILKRLSPDAMGTLTGREGKLSELLTALADEARGWPIETAPQDWTTFGGSPARNYSIPVPLKVGSEPLWSVNLPRWARHPDNLPPAPIRVAEDSHRLLPYHPLVANDFAIVQMSPRRQHVRAYRLRTGEPTLPGSDSVPSTKEFFERHQFLGVPRFAPSIEGSVLVSLEGFTYGPPELGHQRGEAKLTAIDIHADRKLIWDYSPGPPEWSALYTLAGPPVVAAERVLITLRKRETGREETHIAALDSRDGRLVWKQHIAVAESSLDPNLAELTNLVLTVAGDTVYCNSNNGVVAAIQVHNGHLRWATSYPRTAWDEFNPDRNRLHWFRDLTPCVLYRDVLVVAAADCNRLFALDATTGILLWSTPRELAADAVHLLGANQHELVVSGECLYWFDIRSGELLAQYPEPFKAATGFSRPSPRGYGRGIVAGQRVYWPTRDAVLVFTRKSSSDSKAWRPSLVETIDLARHGATGGNLVWGNGTLLIAGSDQLFAFDAPNRQ